MENEFVRQRLFFSDNFLFIYVRQKTQLQNFVVYTKFLCIKVVFTFGVVCYVTCAFNLQYCNPYVAIFKAKYL